MLAEEIAQYEIPDGSRKINGKYVQSHLHSRLKGTELFACMSYDGIFSHFEQVNFVASPNA